MVEKIFPLPITILVNIFRILDSDLKNNISSRFLLLSQYVMNDGIF